MAGLCFLGFFVVVTNLPSCCPINRLPPASLWRNLRDMLRRQRTVGILLARYATVLMMVPTMAFLPVMMADWPGSSGLHTGLVIAGRTLINALLQYPMGHLADRYDKVTLLLWGCAAMSLAVMLIPAMHSFAAMVGIYLFLGLGEAVLWPVLGAFAAEEGRERFGHGTMMGVFNLAMSAGVFTGALLAGTGLDTLGMQAAFTLTAASIMVLSLIAALLIRSGNRHDRLANDASARETAH